MSYSIARLLAKTSYKSEDCRSALAGQALPRHLGNRVVRLCVVSGLRKHLDFALSADINELCGIEGQEVFARARNAGLIMNNRLPDHHMMRKKSLHPYCIWYPHVATEDTYRQLALTWPDMRYQVGRACAVAGYSQLYQELGLLPDPLIAEEARENENSDSQVAKGARQIFEQIMAAPIRFGVMNDYKRTIQSDAPKAGVLLNGDAAVAHTLTARKKFSKYFSPVEDSPWSYFNITEDLGIEGHTKPYKLHALTDNEIALFTSPLPADLPTIHKDLLVLVAAFDGNLDRYARLRRPDGINFELHCVLPGIYKSFAMAKWLDDHSDILESIAKTWHPREIKTLKRAINARWVMNNDTYRLCHTDVPDDELPYFIWHPALPSGRTLVKLAEARPAMRPQCARACIAGSMREQYTKIMDMRDADDKPVAVDCHLMKEARTCPGHAFFEPDMLRRMSEQGLNAPVETIEEEWKDHIPWRDADIGSMFLSGKLYDTCHAVVNAGQDEGMYENFGAELGRVRLHLSSPPEVIARAAQEKSGMLNIEETD